MQMFRDTDDTQWSITIHVTAVKRVRSIVGVDLYALARDGFRALEDLLGDPIRFVDVLFVLCKDEAAGGGITDEDFGKRMGGDAIIAATDAFVQELIDFFPNVKARQSLHKLIRKGREVGEATMSRVVDEADKMLAAVDVNQAAEQLARKLMHSSGIAPASSASIPADLPCATYSE